MWKRGGCRSLQIKMHHLWIRKRLLGSLAGTSVRTAATQLIALLVPIGALIFLMSCGTDQTGFISPVSNSTQLPSPTFTPTPVPIDPWIILKRSGNVMQDLQSFRFKLIHDEGGSEFLPGMIIEEATGKVIKPDKISVSFNGKFGNGYAIKSGLVTIGPDSYMMNPLTGSWEELDTDVSPLGFFNPSVGISTIMARMQDVFLLENDSQEVYRLKGILDSDALMPLLGKTLNDKFVDVEIKIDAKYMYLTQATLFGRVLESDPEDIVRNIEIKDFNQSFVIQIPQ